MKCSSLMNLFDLFAILTFHAWDEKFQALSVVGFYGEFGVRFLELLNQIPKIVVFLHLCIRKEKHSQTIRFYPMVSSLITFEQRESFRI